MVPPSATLEPLAGVAVFVTVAPGMAASRGFVVQAGGGRLICVPPTVATPDVQFVTGSFGWNPGNGKVIVTVPVTVASGATLVKVQVTVLLVALYVQLAAGVQVTDVTPAPVKEVGRGSVSVTLVHV
jgi:hypothetical protein